MLRCDACPVVPFDPFHPDRDPVFDTIGCRPAFSGDMPEVPIFPVPVPMPPIPDPMHRDIVKLHVINKGIAG